MSEKQVADSLARALEQCLAELVTLRARLPEPYRSNVSKAIEVAKAALDEYQ